MTDPRTIGEVLRSGRLSRGKSLREVGTELDRSMASIKSWERNESDPTPDELERLIEIYDLDRDDVAATRAAPESAKVPAEPEPKDVPAEPEPKDVPAEPEPKDVPAEPVPEFADDPSATSNESPIEDRIDEGGTELADQATGDVVAAAAADDALEAPIAAELDVDAEADTVAHQVVPGVDETHHGNQDEPPVAPNVTRSAPDAQAITGITPVAGTAPATPRRGVLATIRDPEKPWLGYIRAFLTIVGLAVLGWVLVWALRELFAALGELRGEDPVGVEAWLGLLFMRVPAR
jgi:transcriptional regulator with XRE-family HTH domain